MSFLLSFILGIFLLVDNIMVEANMDEQNLSNPKMSWFGNRKRLIKKLRNNARLK